MGKNKRQTGFKLPPSDLSDEDDIMQRIMASMCGLPKLCTTRKCRRAKRCFGPDIHCLVDHAGLLARRFDANLAKEMKELGYDNAEQLDEAMNGELSDN